MTTHTRLYWMGLAAAAALSLLAACEQDAADPADDEPDATVDDGTSEDCPVVVSDDDCDTTQRPFVFVHGTYGSGDNFAHVAALLGSNGFCQDRIIGVEYNSLGDAPGTDGSIDKAIDALLAKYPEFDQVDLGGHSQGTRHCGEYLAEPARAAKVAHYINFSGAPAVGDVETLSLSSEHDIGNMPRHATGENVKIVTFEDEDHFAVAASKNAFVEVYKYLTGNDPKYTEVQCGDREVTIEGIAETFADNTPDTGKLQIRKLGKGPREPGEQIKDVPMSSKTGHFGPITLERGVPYEFTGVNNDGVVTGYQYFTPFMRSNHLVRLLVPASADDGSPVGGLIAMESTDHVVRSDNHTAFVVRWSGGAFRKDLGASLTVDGEEVLTDENSGKAALASDTLGGGTVAIFMYDNDKDGKTDHGLPHSTSFIAFSDVFVDATEPKFVDLSFTAGSEDEATVEVPIRISNWPSKDLLVSVVFQ